MKISHSSLVLSMGPKQAWDWLPQGQVPLARWPPGANTPVLVPQGGHCLCCLPDTVPWGTALLSPLVTLVGCPTQNPFPFRAGVGLWPTLSQSDLG